MAYLIHKKTNKVLAQHVILAKSFFKRLKGLMAKKDFAKNKALWILPCRGGIHTFFMKFPIDVIFVNRHLQVSKVIKNIKPWRIIELISTHHSVFEFKSPALEHIYLQKGDTLYVSH